MQVVAASEGAQDRFRHSNDHRSQIDISLERLRKRLGRKWDLNPGSTSNRFGEGE
jgi:hypothetical protein